jgi:hypothetical protein
MDRTATEAAIKIYLREIANRLEKSSSVAKAACACAAAGNIDGAVEIILDIEQPAYEASRLLDAASLLNRLSQD